MAKARAGSKRAAASENEPTSVRFDGLAPVVIYRTGEETTQLANLKFGRMQRLRFTEVRILTQLCADRPVTVNEISRRANIDKAWISRLSRELEEKGLVIRQPDPADSRAVRLSLSPAGVRAQETMLATAIEDEREMLRGVDRKALLGMLEIIRGNLRRMQG